MRNAVLFIFFDTKTGKVLSELRPKNHPHYPNQTTFPAGKVDEGESFKDTLIREATEEFNVIPIKFTRLGEQFSGSKDDVSLLPFLITEWKGDLPATVLDKGNDLVWETLDEVSSSPIPTRAMLVERIKEFLISKSD